MDERRIDRNLPEGEPSGPKVLFATTELAPLVKVGGLSEASSGLVGVLRTMGALVELVMPDYGLIELRDVTEDTLDHLPSWCPPVTVRRGWADYSGEITLLSFPGSERPHPYVDPGTGQGWTDNDEYFMTFATALAQLAVVRKPDVVHCNDWHTATAVGRLPADTPSVLTVHNLAHQGATDAEWAQKVGVHGRAFLEKGAYNALAGGISLADKVVMVSQSYAAEAVRPATGFGLHERLIARGDDLVGIRNGIDLGLWHPSTDPLLPYNYDQADLSGKELCRKELLSLTELAEDKGPVLGVVARLDHQKGIDLALSMAPFLENLHARLVVIGSGSIDLARLARLTQTRFPDRVHVFDGYDERLAHLVVSGSDLLMVPSRFEPCGLTQMQAMTCGTIPVVTDVGGLRDTVLDIDANRRAGTGYVARDATSISLLDALHRAIRGWSNPRRRAAIQRRGMNADWSWAKPARRHMDLYEELMGEPAINSQVTQVLTATH